MLGLVPAAASGAGGLGGGTGGGGGAGGRGGGVGGGGGRGGGVGDGGGAGGRGGEGGRGREGGLGGVGVCASVLSSETRKTSRTQRLHCEARRLCMATTTGRSTGGDTRKLNKHGQEHRLRVLSAPHARRSQVNKRDDQMKEGVHAGM